jgi:hypothetical protein
MRYRQLSFGRQAPQADANFTEEVRHASFARISEWRRHPGGQIGSPQQCLPRGLEPASHELSRFAGSNPLAEFERTDERGRAVLHAEDSKVDHDMGNMVAGRRR